MANNENLIPIPGRLHSVATEGHVAGANEIYDDTLAKDQATINSEVNTALGTGGTVDSRIATAKAEVIGGASTDYNTLGKVEGKVENIADNVAYIDDSSSSPAVVPSFDPESQTVHVTAQTLSEQQKAQVRDNIGLGDVDAKINEAVASEASQRAAAVSSVQNSVNAEATARANAVSAEATRAQAAEADRYTKSETYTKEEVHNLITTPSQEYVSVTATAQTTAVTDVLPATGAADTTYRVGNWDGTQYNDSVFSEYAWNGSTYIKLDTKSQIGEVYDISANHADTKYADLSAALGTNGANIPESLRKGGMSVKFLLTSDNKYVQYTLKTKDFSTQVSDWDGLSELESRLFDESNSSEDTINNSSAWIEVFPFLFMAGRKYTITASSNISSFWTLNSSTHDVDKRVDNITNIQANVPIVFIPTADAHYWEGYVTGSVPCKVTIQEEVTNIFELSTFKSGEKVMDVEIASSVDALVVKENSVISASSLINYIKLFSLVGKDNTYVYKDITNVREGERYTIVPSKKTWAVAQNQQSWSIYGFCISAIINNSEVDKYGVKIDSGSSQLNSNVEPFTIVVPENCTALRVGFRAINNYKLDVQIFNSDIYERYYNLVSGGVSEIVLHQEPFSHLAETGGKCIAYSFVAGKKYLLSFTGTITAAYTSNSSTWGEDRVETLSNFVGTNLENIEYIPESGALYITFWCTSSGTLKIGTPSIQDDIEYLYDLVGEPTDILKLYPEVEYLPKVATLKKRTPYGWSPQNTPYCFLWFSDIHGDVNNFRRINKWNTKYNSYIDDIINCGDTVTDNISGSGIDSYDSMVSINNKVLTALGNHDVCANATSYKGYDGATPITTIYNMFTKKLNILGMGIVQPENAESNGYNFYYKDYPSGAVTCKPLRVIILDSCITPAAIIASGSGNDTAAAAAYVAAQLSWFEQVLDDAKTNNYAVVACAHGIRPCTELSSNTAFTKYGVSELLFDNATYLTADFVAAVNTFKQGGGEFVCWLSGHVHDDHIAKVAAYPDQLVIAINTATSRSYGASDVNPYRTAYNTNSGITKTTDAFDMVEIDTYYKVVRLVAVGTNYDIFGRHKDMIAINYDTCSILM